MITFVLILQACSAAPTSISRWQRGGHLVILAVKGSMSLEDHSGRARG